MKTERLYYADSYLTEFAAVVLETTTLAGRPVAILDRTAFYPTSGGQPNDLGSLGGVEVMDVVDQGETIAHVLSAPLEAGTSVTGRVLWDRRFDHMQQHTGQHILSQAVERACGARTVSFHLGDEYCTIDVDRTPLGIAELAPAEQAANAVVLEDRSVNVLAADAGESERLGLRKATARTGELRIVEIEGYDRSACGGTHCARTGSVGPIKIRRWERRGGDTRLEFVCGWRALRDYARKHDAVKTLAERLSAKDSDLVAVVGKALEDLRVARDENEALRKELLEHRAAELAAEGTTLALADGRAVRLVVRELSISSADDLKRVAQILTSGGAVIALLGGVVGGRSHFVFAQSPGLPFDMSRVLRAAMAPAGGRGGGSRDLAQGGAPGEADITACLGAGKLALTDLG